MTRRRANARLVVSIAGTILVCLILAAVRRTVMIAMGAPPHGLDQAAVVTTLFAGVAVMTQLAVWIGKGVNWCADVLTAPDEPLPAWGEGSELLS
jgi:hypothetical protein